MKVVQLFEKFPLFYQPYIPPVLDELKKDKAIEIKIWAYKGKSTSKDVFIAPTYIKRKIIEKIYGLASKSQRDLNYISIKAFSDKIDIIHLQHSFLFAKILPILNSSLANRPKIIITLRGGDTYVKPWIYKKWQDFFKQYGNMVNAFIVMSQNQKKYLMRWGVKESIIKVIPISFGFPKKITHRTLNNKIKLVSVFRLCWEKNIDGNLRLIKELVENGMDIEYHIYGNGTEKGKLFYLIDKLKLTDVVFYKGKLPNKDLMEELPNYDFIVQLSLSESLGMSIIEAQSFGIPAIVSNNGGLPEIVSHNVNGFIVEDNFKEIVHIMKQVIEGSISYKNLSENSIRNANNNFTIQLEAEKTLSLYKELIKNS